MFLFIINAVWEYDGDEINTRLESSLETPLVAGITSTFGSKGRLINESFPIVAKILSPYLAVDFTTINCHKSHFCHDRRLPNTPKVWICRSKSPKYWKYTDELDISGISNFLRYELSGELLKGKQDDFSIQDYITTGGSFFHATINYDNRNIINTLKAIHSKFKIYNITFAYSLSYEMTRVRAFYTNTCYRDTNILISTNLETFVANNAFSAYHHYIYDEYKDIKHEFMILYVGYDRSIEKIKVLSKLAEKTGCDYDVGIGFASLMYDKWILEMTNSYPAMEPFLVGLNTRNKCYYHVPNITKYNVDDIFQNLRSDANCIPFKNLTKNGTTAVNPLAFMMFLGVIFGTAFAVYIFYLFTCSPTFQKIL